MGEQSEDAHDEENEERARARTREREKKARKGFMPRKPLSSSRGDSGHLV